MIKFHLPISKAKSLVKLKSFYLLFISGTLSFNVTAQTKVILNPVADAFVRSGTYASVNYGNDTSLVVKGSTTSGFTRYSYLKFSITSISRVASAKLRVYGHNTENNTTVNLSAYGLDDDSWSENLINFSNAPAASTAALSSLGVNGQVQYYEFDITNYVTTQLSGDKVVSLVIKDLANINRNIAFNSKEYGQNIPELVIDTALPAAATTFAPIADAYVRDGSSGNTNYGTDTSLILKGTTSAGLTRYDYLKFPLSVNKVTSAKLRLYGRNTESTASITVSSFGVADNSWTEGGITFNNAPPLTLTSKLGSANVNDQAKYYEFDVTDFVKFQAQSSSMVSFIVKDMSNANKTILFNSKENSQNPPQLVIDTTTITSSNASLFVENPDLFPSNDNFVFSRIQVPWTRDSVYNANHDSLKVRIHNNGINPLIITNLTLSNDTTWKIDKLNGTTYVPGSGLPVSLSTGTFIDVTLKFIATDQAVRAKILNETLTITSNDDKNPSKKVFLHGLWQRSGEGNHEPYLQEIINTFGFTTTVGFTYTDFAKGDTTKLKGDEIKPSYFLRADPALPVSVRQMGAYHGCCYETERIQWYVKGSGVYTTIFSHIIRDGQTLLPRRSSPSTPASGTITPAAGTPFGFRVGSTAYTDATQNTGKKLGIRVYKALDANGNIIPNAYILSNDYVGTTSTNYDYQDNTYYVTNVKPEVGTVFYSTLSATPSDLDFGEKVLQTNNTLPLTIQNSGQTYSNGTSDPSITISSMEIVGENRFEFSAALPASTTLTPQQTSVINVRFNPLSQGLKIADLLIHYNNSLSPLRVPLYGIGKATDTSVVVNYRIKAGSTTPVTINGKTWKPDTGGDTTYAFDNLEPYTNPAITQIAGTDEDALYVREQSSNADKKPFRYQLTLPNGNYVVRLHFAEIYWGVAGTGLNGGAGSRVMNVKLENQYRLVNFDIDQEVRGATAVIKNIPVTVTDGVLNIDFSATINRPSLSALEVYSFVPSGSGGRSAVAVNNIALPPAIVSNDNVKIFPNPIHKTFNIEFSERFKGNTSVQLIDMFGRVYQIGKTKLTGARPMMNIDISQMSLNSGMYFLKIDSDGKKAEVFKVIVK